MANLFPTEAVVVEEAQQEVNSEVTFGSSWRFDYEAGDFVLSPTGRVVRSDPTMAWIEWCKKALNTERYKYLAYTRNHGQEFDDLIGTGLTRATLESEIERITTETLLTDPRTASVGNFVFNWEDDACFFSCSITNARDETSTLNWKVATA